MCPLGLNRRLHRASGDLWFGVSVSATVECLMAGTIGCANTKDCCWEVLRRWLTFAKVLLLRHATAKDRQRVELQTAKASRRPSAADKNHRARAAGRKPILLMRWPSSFSITTAANESGDVVVAWRRPRSSGRRSWSSLLKRNARIYRRQSAGCETFHKTAGLQERSARFRQSCRRRTDIPSAVSLA